MAFLDNSGDIILDAVLTDAGRQRMARGEFKIVKFALSDEEINYTTYDANHPSGSAFSDLQIMQTPILESFTNNTSLMKTKLVSINRNNILYLPIFRLNNKSKNGTLIFSDAFGGYYVSANPSTDESIDFLTAGVFPHDLTGQDNVSKFVFIDQGQDTGGQPDITQPLSPDLIETAFLVRLDHRLLRLHRGTEEYTQLANSFVDDDAIASYYVSSTDLAVQNSREYDSTDITSGKTNNQEMFNGPIGNRLKLMIKTAVGIQSSDSLFDELGTSVASDTGFPKKSSATVSSYKFIDTVVNVVGVTSGYSIDIPIRILRTPTS